MFCLFVCLFVFAIVIAQEKGHQQLRHGIEQFDTAKMNKVETLEKNPLPTQEGSHHLSHFDNNIQSISNN